LGTARSIAGIQENSAFRTNLVLANSSEAQAEVELELFDAGDAALGSQRVVLQPLGMTQLNRVVRTFGVAGEIAGAICFCRPRNRSAVSPPTRR
jgi:hypothetical protein